MPAIKVFSHAASGSLPARLFGDTYDHPWKLALQSAFSSFIAFYFFPEASAQIDWPADHEFLKQEMRQIVPESEVGRAWWTHS